MTVFRSGVLRKTRAAKLAEIVAAANAVKDALSSRYSALEESTWPEQEAGARAFWMAQLFAKVL